MAARTPRSTWSGSLTFGLVSVPVKLFPATAARELRFHQLHDKDGGRIREKRVCSLDGEEVPYEHVIKGYPLSKDQLVPIQREELEALAPKSSKTIEIEDFVHLEEIDPKFYDATYYLVPEPRAARPYSLLLQAMERTGRVGMARVVLRTKQTLCAVRPQGRALVLSTMRFADELVSPDDLEGLPDPQDAHPTARELEMAERLIEGLAAPFDPARYRDTYREQVLELVERKARGEEIVTREAEKPVAVRGDLADVLAQSLAQVSPRRREPAHGERRHRPSAAARRRSR